MKNKKYLIIMIKDRIVYMRSLNYSWKELFTLQKYHLYLDILIHNTDVY